MIFQIQTIQSSSVVCFVIIAAGHLLSAVQCFHPSNVIGLRQNSLHDFFKGRSCFQCLMSMNVAEDDAITTEDDGPPCAGPSISFKSGPTQVYIEETDAYGIMYNGNYLRAFDRALHLASTTFQNNEKNQMAGSMTCQHENWSIVSFGHQKFISSPNLGDKFIIEGTRGEKYTDDWEMWDLKMTNPDGTIVYNTVTDMRIARSRQENGVPTSCLDDIQPFLDDEKITKTRIDDYTICRDEIDAHCPNQLPIRIVLNLFERSRSDGLGGPTELRRLQQEDGILAVVTGISSCSLVDNSEGLACSPGQIVQVESKFSPKRRGMVLEIYQSLKSDGFLLAQGKITLMMLDTTSGRPTSKLPSWLKDTLGIDA